MNLQIKQLFIYLSTYKEKNLAGFYSHFVFDAFVIFYGNDTRTHTRLRLLCKNYFSSCVEREMFKLIVIVNKEKRMSGRNNLTNEKLNQ